ncbi:MAG: UDP-3-O-(3-hydroxymyristoyl)glucosamine N-acyltransferase, partial [Planctomycetota bacterium]
WGAAWGGAGGVAGVAGATLAAAGPGELSFLNNPRYAGHLATTRAAAVVVSPADAERIAPPSTVGATSGSGGASGMTSEGTSGGTSGGGTALLVAEDPYFAFRQAMVILHGFRPQPAVGISPQAYLDETAVVGELCTVRPFAYVAPGARLGDRVILYPGSYVGKKAVIGNDCVLHPGVCVYDRCVVGDRVTLHANTVVGEDGLGYATAAAPAPGSQNAPDSESTTGNRDGDADGHEANEGSGEVRHHKMPQAGNAVIGDDVEIGANCSIDRATLGSTVIGAGSKLSNNVVIGHGVKLGRHNMIVAHVGIAGSTVTGDYVTMGGQVGIAGHLTIGSRVTIAADAKVMADIPDGETWGGTPATPLSDAKRVVLNQKRIPTMIDRLRTLEKRVAELEAKD